MPARTREQLGSSTGQGSVTNAIPWTYDMSDWVTSPYRKTSDVVGEPQRDNPFDSEYYRKIVSPVLTGTSGSRKFSGHAVPFMCTHRGGPAASWLLKPTLPDDNAGVTKLLAGTSPSRPVVALPEFIAELKDLPRMVKQAGDAIRWYRNANSDKGAPAPTDKDLANANLAYQFGWAPLISDVWKLLTFADAFQKKAAEMEKLYSKGGLRRTIRLGENTWEIKGTNVHLHSAGVNIYGNLLGSSTGTLWGSVRWSPIAPPPGGKPSDRDVYAAALGLGPSLSMLWELVPWSWLIDYFTNIGDYLMMHRNTVPATPTRICIMRKWEWKYTVTEVPSTAYSWAGASYEGSHKMRTPKPALVYPAIGLPFLGARQLSILGSLLILKAQR